MKKITIDFEIEPGDYHGINPNNVDDIKELVMAMIEGEADFPEGNKITIVVEDA